MIKRSCACAVRSRAWHDRPAHINRLRKAEPNKSLIAKDHENEREKVQSVSNDQVVTMYRSLLNSMGINIVTNEENIHAIKTHQRRGVSAVSNLGDLTSGCG